MVTKLKLTITLLFVFLYSVSIYSQDYYWNEGEKISVKISNHKNYYLFYDVYYINKKRENLEINSKKVFNKNFHWAFGKIELDNSVEYVSPAIIHPKGDTLKIFLIYFMLD